MPVTLLLTDELANALAAAVAKGVPIETAAQAAGLGPHTLYDWLQAGRSGEWRSGNPVTNPENASRLAEFSELIASAQATWEAKQVQSIVEDADAYNQKTGLRDWRARAWLLNNHPRTRQRYRQEQGERLLQ